MKLLTHNMLSSKCIKGVNVGFPLGITAREIKVNDVDFNPDFVSRIIPKLDWTAFTQAAESVSIGHLTDLPKSVIADFENNTDFLKKVHHVLLEVEVVNGDLICPETKRIFPISDGIPNMLLNEDEV
uniref:Multifunctional methyltransferase subunit TRM112-like protein n=1 Tax=Strigamia maritima TaxID=126957 RepID=T1J7S4_STRMM